MILLAEESIIVVSHHVRVSMSQALPLQGSVWHRVDVDVVVRAGLDPATAPEPGKATDRTAHISPNRQRGILATARVAVLCA